ncbi:MAG: glutamyl-tRNA reductase [Alphaproteobacteria bacterium]|nr:glutamyl-tRNA reductase [Alphaproteobacteria bacterium]
MPALRLVVAGVDHRTAPADLRDRLQIEDRALPDALAQFKAAGFSEAVVLSTCDRVVVVGLADGNESAALPVIAAAAGLTAVDLPQGLRLTGAAAEEYLFAVAAALDSQIIGEPQVLGQLKTAHRAAQDLGHAGVGLAPILDAAYGAAKRVRTETRIAEGPVSMAAACAQLCRDLHGDLARTTALAVGSGDMAALLLEQLRAAGLADVVCVARHRRRSEAMAHRLSGHVGELADLPRLLAAADIVVAGQGDGRYVVTREEAELALKLRRRKPIFFADTAVPRDVEPRVEALDGAFVYDLDDLERVAAEGRAGRKTEVERARAILAEEIGHFRSGRAERRGASAVVRLRRRFEAARNQALAETGDAVRATELVVSRLLHAPSERLRRIAAEEGESGAEAALRRLFGDEEEEG